MMGTKVTEVVEKLKVQNVWKEWTRGRVCSAVMYVVYSITELYINLGWKGPQDIFSPNPCSKQGQLWDQTRVLRALDT